MAVDAAGDDSESDTTPGAVDLLLAAWLASEGAYGTAGDEPDPTLNVDDAAETPLDTPRSPPGEPVFEGMPPEDTVPADIPPRALLQIWGTEAGPDTAENPIELAEAVAGERALHAEMAALRRDVQRLNENLESLLYHYVGALHEENDRLRQEVQRLYVMRMQEGRLDGAVPRPGGQVLEQLREEMLEAGLTVMDDTGALEAAAGGVVTSEPIDPALLGQDASDAPAPAPLSEAPGVVGTTSVAGVEYAVVEEWGRSPAEAEAFGAGITSLRGLILAVAPGTATEGVSELAQSLRQTYDEYDNINVKIFAGVEPARHYASTNQVIPGALVADITKHGASQRDLILLMKGDEVTVLPITQTADAASPEAAENARRLVEALMGTPPAEETEEEALLPPKTDHAEPVSVVEEEEATEDTREADEMLERLPLDGPVPILVPADAFDAYNEPRP